MSTIKSGENGAKTPPSGQPAETAEQLGADWEKKNQGAAPRGPGPRDEAGGTDGRALRTPENKKRYLQRE